MKINFDLRLIGRKEIVAEFERRWGITTWWGCKLCCRNCGIRILTTPSGRPFMFISELNSLEKKIIKKITK